MARHGRRSSPDEANIRNPVTTATAKAPQVQGRISAVRRRTAFSRDGRPRMRMSRDRNRAHHQHDGQDMDALNRGKQPAALPHGEGEGQLFERRPQIGKGHGVPGLLLGVGDPAPAYDDGHPDYQRRRRQDLGHTLAVVPEAGVAQQRLLR